jgi:hypothetical protein
MIFRHEDDRHRLGVLGRDERVRLGRAEGIDAVMILVDLPDARKAGLRLVGDGEPPARVARPTAIGDGLALDANGDKDVLGLWIE